MSGGFGVKDITDPRKDLLGAEVSQCFSGKTFWAPGKVFCPPERPFAPLKKSFGRGKAQFSPGKDLLAEAESHSGGEMTIPGRGKTFSSLLLGKSGPEKSFGLGDSL